MYLSPMNFGWLLIAHWLGDYLLQNSKMATRKGKEPLWLFYHVGVYTLIVLVISFWILDREWWITFTLANGLAHLVTDAVSSPIGLKFRERPRIFFLILGTDQLLHLLFLYYSYVYVSGQQSAFFF